MSGFRKGSEVNPAACRASLMRNRWRGGLRYWNRRAILLDMVRLKFFGRVGDWCTFRSKFALAVPIVFVRRSLFVRDGIVIWCDANRYALKKNRATQGCCRSEDAQKLLVKKAQTPTDDAARERELERRREID
jgi:hypothetical protein